MYPLARSPMAMTEYPQGELVEHNGKKYWLDENTFEVRVKRLAAEEKYSNNHHFDWQPDDEDGSVVVEYLFRLVDAETNDYVDNRDEELICYGLDPDDVITPGL